MIKLNSTTYQQIVKDDPKDRIVVEIGDSKQSDFKPQMKIMRWDNEVSFTIKPDLSMIATEDKTLSFEGEKIKFGTPKVDYELYELPISQDLPEGGYEYEVILKEKPVGNIITLGIETQGLDFFYQPELTQQEKDKGAFRPENVVGSYAVYASENKVNLEGGKLYKAGQVGIIYRPKIIDSAGTEVWGILNINKNTGTLTVEIPQEFLDKAIYPVRHAAGLTFGYTTIGGTTEGPFGSAEGHSFVTGSYTRTAVSGDTITGFTIYASGNALTIKMAAYTISGGIPTTRLAVGSSINLSSSANWYSVTGLSQSLTN